MMQSHPNNDNAVPISRHQERLLRLIAEGSSFDTVEAAVEQLCRSCATKTDNHHHNNNTFNEIVLLWQLLGRLQSTLLLHNSANHHQWKARVQTATALERLAQMVPNKDQEAFWQQPPPPLSSDASCTTNTVLRLDDPQVLEPQFWQTLVQRGRPLYSRAASQWETKQWTFEQQRLQQWSDQSLGVDTREEDIKEKKDNDSNSSSLLQQRMVWQRQQLAQRLGLTALLVTQQNTDYLMEEDDDETEKDRPKKKRQRRASSSTTTKTSVAGKKKSKTKSTRKKGRPKQDDDDDDIKEEENEQRAAELSRLLVLELQRSSTNNDNYHSRYSQLNPQCLLATDLLYRMLDPRWSVRHGALLGLSACVRAWQGSLQRVMLKNAGDASWWPQDLVIRAVALLVLDRFGDFSGAIAMTCERDHEDNRTKKKSKKRNKKQMEEDEECDGDLFYHGGVVAPIRETAGQLVALLFTLLAPSQQSKLFHILQHCLRLTSNASSSSSDTKEADSESEAKEEEDVWEIRHGVLAAFKYIAVLLFRNMEREQVLSRQQGEDAALSTATGLATDTTVFLKEIAASAIKHLSDPSDDVVGMAAQILREICKAQASLSTNVPNEFLAVATDNDENNNAKNDSVASQLMGALERVSSFSSAIPDLISLLAELLERRIDWGKGLLSFLASAPQSLHHHHNIFQVLSGLLDSEYESVQVSTLSSLGSLALGMANDKRPREKAEVNVEQNEGRPKQYDQEGMVSALRQLMFHLFQFHWRQPNQMRSSSPGDESEPSSRVGLQLNRTWKQLCSVLALLSAVNSQCKLLLGLEKELLLTFFGHDMLYNNNSLEQCYGKMDTSCDMLALLSKSLGSCFYPSKVLLFTLRVALLSPWTAQCEAGCVLVRSFGKEAAQRLSEFQDNVAQVVTGDPFCVLTRRNVDLKIKLLDANTVCLCRLAFLQGVDMVHEGRDIDAAIISVNSVWNEAFRSNAGASTDTNNALSSIDVSQMRLQASAADAALRCGLPEKLTPFVRSLMSSLKSETCKIRLKRTTKAIAFLLVSICDMPTHAGAYSKILQTLCEAAIEESRQQQIATRDRAACVGAREIVHKTSIAHLHDRSHPIWVWLAALKDGNGSDRAILSGIILVQLLCSKNSSAIHISKFFAGSFAKELVSFSLKHDSAEVRETAAAAIQSLCSVKTLEVLQSVLSSLTHGLNLHSSEDLRVRSCLLLHRIVNETGPAFRPFVRSLLPVVMRLMRDRNAECSSSATNIFSSFVQLAPLIRLEESISICASTQDAHTSAVIDHLILGLPVPPCQLPRSIRESLANTNVSLRSYQEEGISWLHLLQSMQLNGALCDSMGLGKTLQALIAIALSHDKAGKGTKSRSLVVAPSTLVGHWMSEVDRFFPGISVFAPVALYGPASSRSNQWKKLAEGCNLVITSYSVLRTEIGELERQNWTYCVLDEGHLLKNPKTATARASRRISANHKLILSGTIIQNRVRDVWAVFDFLMPNFLGSEGDFWQQYGRSITKSHSNNASAENLKEGMEKLKELHQKVLPFILRREKGAVLKELPPKNVIVLRCKMSEAQSAIYKSFTASAEMKKSILALQKAAKSQNSGEESPKAFGSEVLRSLFFLRLLCTHPALVATKQKKGTSQSYGPVLRDSGKLLALADLLRLIGIGEEVQTGADGDISFLYCSGEEEAQEEDAFDSITETSFAPISEKRRDGEDGGSKCLIFAQFNQSLDVVENALLQNLMPSVNYLRIDGSVATTQRVVIADKFNSDPSVKILLLTTRIGSLGLNLTGADTVVFLEHDWNGFVDLQAMDRAHRIGQTRTVNVYRLVMQDSVEERIIALQQRKIAMNEAVVNAENSSLHSLGTDRLLDVFTVGKTDETDESHNIDLDAILERYGQDYASSLSVSKFVRQSEPRSKSN